MYKGIYGLLIVIMLNIFNLGCQKDNEKKVLVEKVNQVVEEKKEIPSVCIWDDASVRAKPSVKAKRISALALGEKVLWLGEEKYDSVDKKRMYLKIRLSDGTEGWATEKALVTDAKPSVAIKKAPICIRPDLLTVSEIELEPMEIVAVLKSENKWLEVVGDKKEKKGWIQSEVVSLKDEDVALALLARRVLAEKDNEIKKVKIESILNNSAFTNSVFINDLQIKLKEMFPEEIFPHEIKMLRLGLIAYYPFNGNANDESGNSIHGETYHAYLTPGIQGNPNSAYMFNGRDGGYIDMGNSPMLNLGDVGSISLFVNILSYAERRNGIYWYILGKGIKGLWKTNGYCLFYHNRDKVIYGVLENRSQPLSFNKISFGKPKIGEWHHLVMVWDGSFIKAYVDGRLFGRPVKQTIYLPETNDHLIIGKKPSRNPDGYYNGKIDQIRFYDRVLSEREIINLYKIRQ